MRFLRPCAQQLLSVLRIMMGLLLLTHGTTKYLNFPVGPMNNASPMTMGGAAGILELIGGALLAIGLFTRPTAFILSGMCAVAYFYAHAPKGFFPILNGGEAAFSIASRCCTSPQPAGAPGASIGHGAGVETSRALRNSERAMYQTSAPPPTTTSLGILLPAPPHSLDAINIEFGPRVDVARAAL